MTEVLFFIEVVVAGLLAGTMYSLVALGFVLIYKASSTFNFAQGAMVFFCSLGIRRLYGVRLTILVSFRSDSTFDGISWLLYGKDGSKSFNEPK